MIDMNLRKLFGRNLKYYRLINGYTQEVFSCITNSSVSYISNIENGKYGPSFDKISIFSEKLNIRPSLLFETEIDNNINNINIFKKKRDDK